MHSPLGAIATKQTPCAKSHWLAKFAVLTLQRLHLLGHIARWPARLPLSTSVFFTHWCRVAGEQPILPAIDETAAQRGECWASWSSTIRMARLRSSGENLFVVLLMIAPLSQKLKPPANPVRFISKLAAVLSQPQSATTKHTPDGLQTSTESPFLHKTASRVEHLLRFL